MEALEQAIEMLNEVLKRKLNSPAAYVLEASPYVTDEDQMIIAEIEAMRKSDHRHAREAARRILALEGVPQSGSYDPSVADSNYLSVRYLVGQLLARIEQEIALVEQYRDRCEVLEAKDFFAMVVEDDKVHRDRLKEILDRLRAERSQTPTHLP